MTLRTTSATRLRVVSRSSDVANTSATSSSSDSTGKRSGLEMTELIARMIAAAFGFPRRIRRSNRSTGELCWSASCRAKLLSGHNANVGQVAILLRVIQAVADDKFVGNLEANVVALERKLASRGLVE